MAWDAARRHQYGIETHVLERMITLAGEPGLGGRHDTGPLAVGDRPGRVVEFVPRLHLDEDQQAPAGRDDVDLADRAAPAPRQDAKAFGDEIGGGAAFRRDAEPERDLALRLRDALGRHRARLTSHGRARLAAIRWVNGPVSHVRGSGSRSSSK